MSDRLRQIKYVHSRLRDCRKCPNVCGTAVHGEALESPIMLIGQAPGSHEEALGRPFAFKAGKTLFCWLNQSLGLNEYEIRKLIYFSAVARCFPGKAICGSGDRAPSAVEVENCREHLRSEVEALKPDIILAVGRVAIVEVLKAAGIKKSTPLDQLVGRVVYANFYGQPVRVIPLPHPSGVSRWPQSPTGKRLLKRALKLISKECRDSLN